MAAPDPSCTPRILGIDPGTRVLGYGVVDLVVASTGAASTTGPGWQYVECGVIRADTALAMPQRIGTIAAEMLDVMDELRPTAVAIEAAFCGKNAASALKLGQIRGAMMVLAAQRELPVFEYGPTVVKRAVAGHGRATKCELQARVQMLLGLRRAPTEDAADALAIAMCHANYISFPGGQQSSGGQHSGPAGRVPA
ncbi:MAG: crossover junction endodeoxyribonuclease RuvC [Nannocystaceae bacterium]|nr:crossover junction endodeoxyribonuclease RuvC [Nannocystaceae bacterium]